MPSDSEAIIAAFKAGWTLFRESSDSDAAEDHPAVKLGMPMSPGAEIIGCSFIGPNGKFYGSVYVDTASGYVVEEDRTENGPDYRLANVDSALFEEARLALGAELSIFGPGLNQLYDLQQQHGK
jgi:hypothetical protein